MTGRAQEQQNQQAKSKAQDSAPPSTSGPPSLDLSPPAPAREDSKSQMGFQIGEDQRAEGKAGEHNLTLQIADVWVGGARSCRCTVQTADGNGLEVTVTQATYRRIYNGTGTVETSVLPVAPIGTKGKLIAHDTTTGEVLEQPYTWINIGGGFSLWAIIKRLLSKA
jgi:hypothetical protein